MSTGWLGFVRRGICAAGLSLAAVAGWGQGYTIQSLGVLSGTDKGQANDVNNKGEVTGRCQNSATLNYVAFYWSADTGLIGFEGVGPDVHGTEGNAINEHGTVVGEQEYQGITDIVGLAWNAGTTSIIWDYLVAAKGNIQMACMDVNDFGAICGTTRGNDGFQMATIIVDGQHQLLGRHSTDIRSYGHKINNIYHAIMTSDDNPSNVTHYLFWNGSQRVLVDETLGGTINVLTDLNDSDLLVGYSTLPGDTVFHAAYWTTPTGDPVDMGTLGGNISGALGVNNKGEIVGISYLADNTTLRSYLYREGSMTDLYDLLPPGTEAAWTDLYAQAISDTGYICGYGKFNGVERPFLMTPSPPPGTVASYDFSGGAQGWVAVTDIPPFQPGVSSTPSGALGLSAGNGFPVFAFWQSPEIPVEKGKTYRASFTMTSTVLNSDDIPQFRLRVFQVSNNLAWFTAADSVGSQPPAAGETQTYDVVFTPSIDGVATADNVRLYLDFTHFNPFDDAAGTIILQEASVVEISGD